MRIALFHSYESHGELLSIGVLKDQPAIASMRLKTDPSAWLSSLPPGRAGGGWAFWATAPFPHGKGWGWVQFTAAEAVSQLPGPPLEDPTTSPPHSLEGAQLGGARWDDWRTGCPNAFRSAQQRVEDRIALLLRRLCDRRAIERSEWRGGRVAAGKHRSQAIRLGGPGHGRGRRRDSRRRSRPHRIARGTDARNVETPRFDAQRGCAMHESRARRILALNHRDLSRSWRLTLRDENVATMDPHSPSRTP
jgi:hypothetical protein